MSPLQSASLFLTQSVFEFYITLLLLRVILQYLRIDYYNPLCQFIVKVTNPVVVPLRRFIPGWWGLDIATIVIFVLLTFIKNILTAFITVHKFPQIPGLLLWCMGDMAAAFIKVFFYAVIIQVALSWVAPTSRTPMSTILIQLTEPLMRPFRKIVPVIGGFDITPIPVLISLQLLIILLADPLTQTGFRIALH